MTNTFNMPIEELIKYLYTQAKENNAELYNNTNVIKTLHKTKNEKIITLSLICKEINYVNIYRYTFTKYYNGYRFFKEEINLNPSELEYIINVK